MKIFIRRAGNEEGSVLLVALLIMVLLTLIGIAATTTTNIELEISGNEKTHKIAFYRADSGVYCTPKLISLCVDKSAPSTSNKTPGINYLTDNNAFYRQIMGYDKYDGGVMMDMMDISIPMGTDSVEVDVERVGQKILAGGGAEFASGAEGIGVGSAGGVAIFYSMDSFGRGPGNSISNVSAVYRKILGIEGGL